MLVDEPKSPVGLHRIWKQFILPMMSVSGMGCMHNVLAYVLVFTVRAIPKYASSSKVDSSSNATFMTLFLKHPSMKEGLQSNEQREWYFMYIEVTF